MNKILGLACFGLLLAGCFRPVVDISKLDWQPYVENITEVVRDEPKSSDGFRPVTVRKALAIKKNFHMAPLHSDMKQVVNDLSPSSIDYNVVLVGNPGLEVDSRIYALARYLVSGADVPDTLKNRELYQINLGAIKQKFKSQGLNSQQYAEFIENILRKQGNAIFYVPDVDALEFGSGSSINDILNVFLDDDADVIFSVSAAGFNKYFNVPGVHNRIRSIVASHLSAAEMKSILLNYNEQLASTDGVIIPRDFVDKIVRFTRTFVRSDVSFQYALESLNRLAQLKYRAKGERDGKREFLPTNEDILDEAIRLATGRDVRQFKETSAYAMHDLSQIDDNTKIIPEYYLDERKSRDLFAAEVKKHIDSSYHELSRNLAGVIQEISGKPSLGSLRKDFVQLSDSIGELHNRTDESYRSNFSKLADMQVYALATDKMFEATSAILSSIKANLNQVNEKSLNLISLSDTIIKLQNRNVAFMDSLVHSLKLDGETLKEAVKFSQIVTENTAIVAKRLSDLRVTSSLLQKSATVAKDEAALVESLQRDTLVQLEGQLGRLQEQLIHEGSSKGRIGKLRTAISHVILAPLDVVLDEFKPAKQSSIAFKMNALRSAIQDTNDQLATYDDDGISVTGGVLDELNQIVARFGDKGDVTAALAAVNDVIAAVHLPALQKVENRFKEYTVRDEKGNSLVKKGDVLLKVEQVENQIIANVGNVAERLLKAIKGYNVQQGDLEVHVEGLVDDLDAYADILNSLRGENGNLKRLATSVTNIRTDIGNIKGDVASSAKELESLRNDINDTFTRKAIARFKTLQDCIERQDRNPELDKECPGGVSLGAEFASLEGVLEALGDSFKMNCETVSENGERVRKCTGGNIALWLDQNGPEVMLGLVQNQLKEGVRAYFETGNGSGMQDAIHEFLEINYPEVKQLVGVFSELKDLMHTNSSDKMQVKEYAQLAVDGLTAEVRKLRLERYDSPRGDQADLIKKVSDELDDVLNRIKADQTAEGAAKREEISRLFNMKDRGPIDFYMDAVKFLKHDNEEMLKIVKNKIFSLEAANKALEEERLNLERKNRHLEEERSKLKSIVDKSLLEARIVDNQYKVQPGEALCVSGNLEKNKFVLDKNPVYYVLPADETDVAGSTTMANRVRIKDEKGNEEYQDIKCLIVDSRLPDKI